MEPIRKRRVNLGQNGDFTRQKVVQFFESCFWKKHSQPPGSIPLWKKGMLYFKVGSPKCVSWFRSEEDRVTRLIGLK